VIGLDVS